MDVHCPRCERQYSSVLFYEDREVLCACGARVRAPEPRSRLSLSRSSSNRIAPLTGDRRADQRTVGERADRLCRMILSSDYPDVDIAIERGRVRELAEALFPDRMDLYEMIYESRFDRLWEQFRSPERTREVD
jgi:hypothetical protein